MESVWFATHPVRPAAGDFVEGARADVVVAGAGLTGLATAVLLARAGLAVVVLEARHVGAVTTGRTTAKVSLLQGLTLSDIRAHAGDEVLRAYVAGNGEGQAWLERFLVDRDVPLQRRDAFTYATTGRGLAALRDEQDACRVAGLDVTRVDRTELPFSVLGAITLPDQFQVHPLEVLDALLAEFASHGGVLVEGVRVTGASGSPLRITTDRGGMVADRLVLATGTPILDRGGYFAKLTPMRSYVTTYRLPAGETVPRGLYLSADAPTRSLRAVPVDDGELLMVGGNGHVGGRFDSPTGAVVDLRAWTREHFPGAEPVHAWSAQDYRSVNRVPFVGAMPRGGGSIHVATGFNKWGMTNAVAAALRLGAEILGGSTAWADVLGRPVTTPRGVVSAVVPNAQVGVELVRDWVDAELHPLPDDRPAEGEGRVGRRDGVPKGVATVDNTTCLVSAVCTHLGGVLRWNDAELSWDCPLHGSRFAADGTVLEGPATADLAAEVVPDAGA